MRLILNAALACALAACAPPPAVTPTLSVAADAAPILPKDESLAAPQAPNVVRTLSKADAGATVRLAPGEQFAIALVGVPTAGYLWAPASSPAFLARGEDTGGPTHSAQLQPGFAGGNHWEVLTFRAVAKGAGVLKLEQRRPWETSEPPADTFAVTVEVR